MATVRFSADLKDDIIDNAKRMFSDRIRAAQKNIPASWGMTIYDLMYRDTKEKMLALPDGYFTLDRNLAIRGFNGDAWDNDVCNIAIGMDLGKEMPRPYGLNPADQGLFDNGNYGGVLLNADDPRWDAIKSEYITYCKACHAVAEEQAAFTAGVKKIIEAYSTLAPALKAWPPLWDLIPLTKQNKHKEIVERTKKEIVVEGVNMDSLSATVIANKLTR